MEKNIVRGNIGNALHSVATDHIVTTSDEVFDETLQMYQNEINFLDGVFDISAYNLTDGQPTKYADLAAALGTHGDNVPNVPESYRRGGMSVKFVHTSDNNYVQYRLMSDSFNTAIANWQGVDDEPTDGSNNLVKSGGVAEMYGSYVENPEFVEIKLDDNNQIIEATFKDGTKLFPAGINIHDKIDFDGAVTTVVDNPEFVAVWLDSNDRILLGLRSNSDILFGYGVPSQIKAYIDEEIHKVSPEGVQEIIDFIGDYLGNTTLQELLDKKVDGVYVDNPEFVEVKTDNEDKIIEATKKDGTKYFSAGVENNTSKVYSTSNPEFIMAVLDVAHKIIEGIRRDGTKVIGGDLEVGGEVLFDKGIPNQIKDYIAENIPTGSGVSDIEYDDETGDIYATYNDESGVTDVYMEPNGDIYVESEE